MFSRRSLFFTEVGMFYRNTHLHLHSPEGNSCSTDQPYIIDEHFKFDEFFSWNWFDMLREYSGRELSYDHDILRAFSGILHRLFHDSTTFGIPNVHFDKAILWQNVHSSAFRRGSKSLCIFPTWSWTSSYGKVTCLSPETVAAVAFWAKVSPELGTIDNLTILKPKSTASDEITRQDYIEDKRRTEWIFEWGLNFIAGTCQGCNNSCLIYTRERSPWYSWALAEYWRSAFAAYLSDPPFSKTEVAIARTSGRLLCFTQKAHFKVENDPKMISEISYTRKLIIQGCNDDFAGLVSLDSKQTQRVLSRESASAQFIALSVSSGVFDDDSRMIKYPFRQNCRRDHQYEPELNNLGRQFCFCSIRDLKPTPHEYSAQEESIQLAVSEQGKHQSFKIPYFYDLDVGNHGILSPLLVNVMLIESSSLENDQIVQRVGLGQIYLKKWVEAERTTQTFILE
ncbi:MAG: hypothetical protein Q9227_008304 [Pyrenula ochraceoflavens]